MNSLQPQGHFQIPNQSTLLLPFLWSNLDLLHSTVLFSENPRKPNWAVKCHELRDKRRCHGTFCSLLLEDINSHCHDLYYIPLFSLSFGFSLFWAGRLVVRCAEKWQQKAEGFCLNFSSLHFWVWFLGKKNEEICNCEWFSSFLVFPSIKLSYFILLYFNFSLIDAGWLMSGFQVWSMIYFFVRWH